MEFFGFKGVMLVYNFDNKTQIYSGEGSLEVISKLDCKRIFLVTDPFMVQSGGIKKITDLLDESEKEYSIFSNIIPDPPVEVVVKGVEELFKFNPDGIIALGGGSAIDAAKAIWYFTKRLSDDSQKKDTKIKKFIAVPTTSGTGSEVTKFSVITDKVNNIKYPLISDELLPDVAVLDAELVKTVPDFITADTGMDVITHAIEAYVSVKANEFTDALAEKAVKLVFENLPIAYKDGNNMSAREKLHNASCLAGMAFNSASLGLNHGMAHILGAKFKIPHGRSNAILLPYIMEYNANLGSYGDKNYSEAAKRYAEIAKNIGLPASNVRQGVKNLVSEIKSLLKELNLPGSLKDMGIDKKVFDEEVERMAEAAIADRCTETNPRIPEKREVIELFYRVFNGK